MHVELIAYKQKKIKQLVYLRKRNLMMPSDKLVAPHLCVQIVTVIMLHIFVKYLLLHYLVVQYN